MISVRAPIFARLIAGVLAGLLTACVEAAPFPPNTGAIVDLATINAASCGRLPMYKEGAWTPTADMVAPLEAALLRRLAPELERDAAEFGVAAHAPGDYYRRYAGAIADGRRIVVICAEARSRYDDRGMDWRSQTIPVRDGGSESFGAHYDPATHEITDFAFGYVG